MSLKVDKVQLEIIMKSDTTRAEIIKLENEAKSLQKEMKKLSKNPEELAKASVEYDKVKNRISELRKEIGLSNMTIRELQQRQKELNMMMRHMDPSSRITISQNGNQILSCKVYKEPNYILSMSNEEILELISGLDYIGNIPTVPDLEKPIEIQVSTIRRTLS